MKGLDLEQIFSSMKNNDISELIIKEGSKTYEVRRGVFKQNLISPVFQNIPQQPQSYQNFQHQESMSVQKISEKDSTHEKKSNESGKSFHEIKSPLVGTFYSSPKPDSPHFVELGSKITKGQTLCLVEAMKNFNEIESDVDGIVREICIKNLELVEFGKVLFKIELL
jgi:acetyl-CoA carboxylase biotin carboxyl carrier protein